MKRWMEKRFVLAHTIHHRIVLVHALSGCCGRQACIATAVAPPISELSTSCVFPGREPQTTRSRPPAQTLWLQHHLRHPNHTAAIRYCISMDSPFRVSATPGTPLFPISPERANKQPPNHAMTNPPPAPTLSFHDHSRTSSDVQGKVEKFNSLTKEASERRRAHEAALKRAIVGREEAENEARRTKDELRKLKAELS